MRVALYARYSSDQQRAASIDDQLRRCRQDAEHQGWEVVAEYQDSAVSGATLMRRGIQSLMRDAAAKAFDVVFAESLDRFSRDQADVAMFARQLKFARIKLITVVEGEIGPLHIGLKGTMNALYLEDLADKTRRGLQGRVAAGRSGGGICFGYRAVAVREGEPRGQREIIPEEAAVVERIFRAFVEGVSPKAISKTLNSERVRGPRGGAWSASTIHGNPRRGTGILNNELYVGRIVWNRQRFVKNPDTGKRVPQLNAAGELTITDVPDLRIIDNELWQAAKARQAATRQQTGPDIVRARRPKYLFSGLTKCGVCGGGFILSSHNLLTCFNARDRGTCTNTRRIKRSEIESRVLRAMQERFFDAGAFEEFCAGFTEEMNRLRREHRAKVAAIPRELEVNRRRSKEILNLLLEGFRNEAWKAELRQLDERNEQLNSALAAAESEPSLPAFHPQMAEVFRRKATALAAALDHQDERDAARTVLRGFLDRIVIPPRDGLLQVVGNLGEMLAAASGRRSSPLPSVGYVGCGGGI
jgi:site-specific DNA recombinase